MLDAAAFKKSEDLEERLEEVEKSLERLEERVSDVVKSFQKTADFLVMNL